MFALLSDLKIQDIHARPLLLGLLILNACSSADTEVEDPCILGLCAGPTCTDGLPNGDETDVDCGGSTCEPCAEGKLCQHHADCVSGTCEQRCQSSALSIEPPQHDFGPIDADNDDARTFIVENSGRLAAKVNELRLGATEMVFEIVDDTCSQQSLEPGANCRFSIRFTPGSEASFQAQLTLTQGDGTVVLLELKGRGRALPEIELSAFELNLGSSYVGISTPEQALKVYNRSNRATRALSTRVTGNGTPGRMEGPFVVRDDCPGFPDFSLPPNSECTIWARFSPSSPGAASAEIEITEGASQVFEVALSATALSQGELGLSPTEHDFGSQLPGSVSETQVFLVSFEEAVAAFGKVEVSVHGQHPDAFRIVSSTCAELNSTARSCSVQVQFNPQTLGSKTAVLQVSSETGLTTTSTLVGRTPGLRVPGEAFTFATIDYGDTRETDVQVARPSGYELSVELAGARASSFSLVGPLTCASAELCTQRIRYSPQEGGNVWADVRFSTRSGQSATARVQAFAPIFRVTPSGFDFGATPLGQTRTQAFSVENMFKGDPVPEVILRASGFAFQFEDHNCPSAFVTGQKCTVNLSYRPINFSQLTSTGFSIAYNSNQTASQAVSVQGHGVNSEEMSISPTAHDFGTIAVGAMSPSQRFTLENIGTVPLRFLRTSLSNTTGAFQLLSSTCHRITLDPNESCEISVRFSPTDSLQRAQEALTVLSLEGRGVLVLLEGRAE